MNLLYFLVVSKGCCDHDAEWEKEADDDQEGIVGAAVCGAPARCAATSSFYFGRKPLTNLLHNSDTIVF